MGPAEERSDGIQMRWELSRSAIDTPEGIRLIVMARLAAPEAEKSVRAPLNLSLALDRSGSMSGDKLEQCKHSARFIVNQLAPRDHLSVVAFDSTVDVIVPHEPVQDKSRITKLLGGLRAQANTNLSGGWLQGCALVDKVAQKDWVNRVILLTDGQANEGVVDSQQLCGIAQGWRLRGIQTTCVGFGSDFNEDLLLKMSQSGGGNFHYIRTNDEAMSIFSRELQELLTVAAQNVRLLIEPSPAVKLVGVLQQYVVRSTPKGIEVDLGDLLCGDEKRLLIEFVVPKSSSPKERHGVSVLTLSYQQVIGQVAARELAAFVETPEGGASDVAINPMVWREVLLNDVATAMKKAVEDADTGRLGDARTRILETKEKLQSTPYAQDPDFVQQTHELERMAEMLVNREMYRTQGRKSLYYSSSSISTGKSFTKGGRLQPITRMVMSQIPGVTFVTGPGLATDAGLPRFDHLPFEGVPARELLRPATTPEELARQWRWIRRRQEDILEVPVGTGYDVISRIGSFYSGSHVVATSADGLLQRFFGTPVAELYGSFWEGRCPKDAQVYWVRSRDAGPGPAPGATQKLLAPWQDGAPLCECGAPLHPNLAWPGAAEALAGPLQQAQGWLAEYPVAIVVGTLGRSEPLKRLLVAHKEAKRFAVAIGPFPEKPEWAIDWIRVDSCAEGLEILNKEAL